MSKVTQLKPRYITTLAEKVERLRTYDREIKRLTIEFNALKSEVTHEFGDSTECFNENGHMVATYYEKSRETFNTKALKEHSRELYDQFLTKTTFREFRFK